MENGVENYSAPARADRNNIAADDSNLLDVNDLVQMFEDSEDATFEARQQAERDRDYYDNKQLTEEEKRVLRKRGQPEVIINRIKRKINFLVGFEKDQGVDPIALPNTPIHEQDAEGATQALRSVDQVENYDKKRSAIWKNLLIEGAGGISVGIKNTKYGIDVRLKRVAWDRMFWDPHSSEQDFSDANYYGLVVWMDLPDVYAEHGDTEDIRDIVEATMNTVSHSDTYDDKPKYRLWADRKRRRVRICQIWVKRAGEWYWAEFTKGGILKAGKSPYLDQEGKSEPELLFASGYIDRDNNRYGVVREMISPQDEINKRRSKALHRLNTTQIITVKGVFPDSEKARREANRPDGFLEMNPVPGSENTKINTGADLAAAEVQLLQHATNEIDLMGPNATMLGDKTGGSAAASGKAIIASQQGGAMEITDILESLRDLDKRVYRAVWNRIRQYWTGQKWVRVTDDERNVKWVGVNVPPDMLQMAQQQNPDIMERITGTISNVAELDCDITIEEVPDTLTPALEQFEALVSLKQFDRDNELPFRALVEAAPNLKNKDRVLAEMDKAAEARAQQAQARDQLEVEGAVAEIDKTKAGAAKDMAQAEKTAQETAMAPMVMATKALPAVMPQQQQPRQPQRAA